MGAVARSREQHDRVAGTAPIEDFETNTFFNCDELTRMFRWTLPSRWLLRAHGYSEHEPEHSRQVRCLRHEFPPGSCQVRASRA